MSNSAPAKSNPQSEERRLGPGDRRSADEDRRNEERLADELVPRRNPDIPDRRVS